MDLRRVDHASYIIMTYISTYPEFVNEIHTFGCSAEDREVREPFQQVSILHPEGNSQIEAVILVYQTRHVSTCIFGLLSLTAAPGQRE